MRNHPTFTITNAHGPEKSAKDYRRGIMDLIVTLEPAPPPMPTIIESELCLKTEEDWSGCRSPSRAMRRRKLGHRQNVVTTEVPCAIQVHGILYVHPEIMKKLNDRIRADVKSKTENMMMDAIRGIRGGW